MQVQTLASTSHYTPCPPLHVPRDRPRHSSSRSAIFKVVADPPAELSSPIGSLPVELISRIFHAGIEDDVLDRELDPREPEEPGVPFEVLVSCVSRTWRRVALESATLWRAIVIRKRRHMPRPRSRQVLIDVVIDTAALKDYIPGLTLCREEINDVFDIILPHVARWRSFTLKVRDDAVKERARSRLSQCGDAPQVEALKLFHVEEWPDAAVMYQAMQKAPVCLSGSLPRISHLSLVGVSFPWGDTPYWRNLQSLELRLHGEAIRPEYHQWEQMLLNSPGLQKLALHYSGPQHTVSAAHAFRPIPLPALRELTLVDLDSDHLCYIFRPLVAPNVRVLRLDLPDQDVTPFMELVADPAAPVFARLELLAITSLECSVASWRALLLSVRSLLTLELDLRRMHSTLMDEIMTGACKPEILSALETPAAPLPSMLMPALQTVKVKGITGSALERLCMYRRKGGCAVKKWLLDSKSRDEAVEALRDREPIEYFQASDDEEEMDDSDDSDEASDGDGASDADD